MTIYTTVFFAWIIYATVALVLVRLDFLKKQEKIDQLTQNLSQDKEKS